MDEREIPKSDSRLSTGEDVEAHGADSAGRQGGISTGRAGGVPADGDADLPVWRTTH